MVRTGTLILLALLAASPCMAGKNAGGALIVHTSNTYNWCNLLVCTTPAGQPATCEEANTEATRGISQVVWLLAAFPADSDPGVSVIYFGIDYDDSHLDPGVNYRLCGPAGSLEVPDDDWPYSGRGNSVAFGSPVLGNRLFRFYAFRIDGGIPGAYFRTTINPAGGYAAFVDDGNPPMIDACYRFGTVLWFEPGHNMCPPGSEGGACCFADGNCSVLSQSECEVGGGSYLGDGTSCDPNPCEGVQTACCLPGEICVMLDAADCVLQGGAPRGPEVPCDPNPCVPEACCWLGGGCSIVDWYECSQQGGAPAGPGSVCDPNPCTQPGACCFPNGACEVLPEVVCAAHGGAFQGEETPCDPNPCPPSATESTTWGRIRATYRQASESH